MEGVNNGLDAPAPWCWGRNQFYPAVLDRSAVHSFHPSRNSADVIPCALRSIRDSLYWARNSAIPVWKLPLPWSICFWMRSSIGCPANSLLKFPSALPKALSSHPSTSSLPTALPLGLENWIDIAGSDVTRAGQVNNGAIPGWPEGYGDLIGLGLQVT